MVNPQVGPVPSAASIACATRFASYLRPRAPPVSWADPACLLLLETTVGSLRGDGNGTYDLSDADRAQPSRPAQQFYRPHA